MSPIEKLLGYPRNWSRISCDPWNTLGTTVLCFI